MPPLVDNYTKLLSNMMVLFHHLTAGVRHDVVGDLRVFGLWIAGECLNVFWLQQGDATA